MYMMTLSNINFWHWIRRNLISLMHYIWITDIVFLWPELLFLPPPSCILTERFVRAENLLAGLKTSSRIKECVFCIQIFFLVFKEIWHIFLKQIHNDHWSKETIKKETDEIDTYDKTFNPARGLCWSNIFQEHWYESQKRKHTQKIKVYVKCYNISLDFFF